jgi:hypothetical protein
LVKMNEPYQRVYSQQQGSPTVLGGALAGGAIGAGAVYGTAAVGAGMRMYKSKVPLSEAPWMKVAKGMATHRPLGVKAGVAGVLGAVAGGVINAFRD